VFGWLYVPAAYGWLGVHLFFMISGFVICMSSWGRTATQFAVSRIVRLFPAYWAAIALTTAFVLLYPALFEPQKLGDVLTNLTMLQEQFGVPHVDPVYWSLVAELKFYLLFLIVAAFGVTYRRAVIFCVVWSIGAAFAVQLDSKALKLFLMPNFAHYFVAGVALYLMYRFGPNLVLWGIIGYSWVIAMHYRTDSSFPGEVGLPYWPAAVLITACFAVLILLALRRLQWMRWRFLTTLGVTTYPLYLLHYVIGTSAVYFVAKHWAVNAFVLFAIVVAGLVVLSWLVHRFIERPLAPRLKRGLTGGLETIRRSSPS
jgi:peptidoglycan/LPS O-acetylase OafA/YrhL